MNCQNKSDRPTNKTKLLVMLLATAVLLALSVGCTQKPKQYGPPERTYWAPEGPRTLPNAPEIVGSPATFWRAHHSDTVNSDEVRPSWYNLETAASPIATNLSAK